MKKWSWVLLCVLLIACTKQAPSQKVINTAVAAQLATRAVAPEPSHTPQPTLTPQPTEAPTLMPKRAASPDLVWVSNDFPGSPPYRQAVTVRDQQATVEELPVQMDWFYGYSGDSGLLAV